MNDVQEVILFELKPDTPKPLKTSTVKNWIKTLGFWGFLFFLVKGLLWLTIPALIAFFAS